MICLISIMRYVFDFIPLISESGTLYILTNRTVRKQWFSTPHLRRRPNPAVCIHIIEFSENQIWKSGVTAHYFLSNPFEPGPKYIIIRTCSYISVGRAGFYGRGPVTLFLLGASEIPSSRCTMNYKHT